MEEFTTIFKPRELATFAWVAIVLILFLFVKDVRRAGLAVLRAFFQKSILSVIALSMTYSAVVTYLLSLGGFWDSTLLKDTVFWFFGSALIVLFNLVKAKDRGFFKNLLLDNIKLVVVLQFIANVHSFSFVIELILLPIIAFIAMVGAYSKHNKEYEQVGKLANVFLTAFGIIFLVFSIFDIAENAEKFMSFRTIKSFLLPIIFSTAFVPWAYLVTLFIKYEMVYVRLERILSSTEKVKYAKRRVFQRCHFRISKLESVSSKINELYNGSTKDDIKKMIM